MGKRNMARVIIPCRFAYLNCWRKKTFGDGKEKYGVTAIISKEDTETIRKISEAIEFVKQASQAKWGGKIPPNLRSPLHDGDIEKSENPAFRNAYYINTKSTKKPQVVDENIEPIVDETEVYSGCYGRVSVVFFAYNFSGNRGISTVMCHIQKLKDGEVLDGTISAIEDFSE